MATGRGKSGERGGENRRLKYCPHCGAEVPKSTYYRHRDKYFDVVKKVWRLPKEDAVKQIPTSWHDCNYVSYSLTISYFPLFTKPY